MSIFTQGHPIFIAATEADVYVSNIHFPNYCFIYCVDTRKLLRYVNGTYTRAVDISHEDLLQLQGGQAGEYYHLNAAEYGFRNTAATSIYQQTSAMSNYLTNIKVSAGSISSNISAIVFGNSNNVSFGMDSGTITATVNQSIQTQLIAGIYDGANSITSGTLVFSNSNGITFGINGQTITAAHNGVTAPQSQQPMYYSASGSSSSSNTLQFGNTNGISFSISNGSIVGTVATNYQSQGAYLTTAAQSSQTLAFSLGGNSATTNSSQVLNGGYVLAGGNNITIQQSNNTISISAAAQTVQTQSNIAGIYDGVNSISTGTIRFTNANGVSFSINGQTLSASVAAQTNQTLGLYAIGNTTQNSSTTLDARTLSFNGLGAATVGYSNGSIQVSVPTQTVQTQSNVAGIYDGANSITTGTVRFSNSNGISFGINGQTITASHNGITSQTAQTVGLYALGNTTQNSSTTLDARTLNFNGLGAATVGYSNGSIQVSVPVQTVQTQSNIQAIAGGGATATTGTVIFSNSNGISFGLNGQTMTGSHNGITSQSNQNISLYALGNTTQNSSTVLNANALSFNGLGNATLGFSNGSIQVSITAAGGGGITNINVSAGTTSNNLSALTFADSNGISFGLSGNSVITATVKTDYQSSNANYLTSQSNQAFSAQGGSSAFQTLVFTNSNGISFSNTNGSIWASHNGITSQTAQTIGLYALGNTTQNSSTTLDARTLSFNGLGIVTVGYSNGSIQISATTAAQSNQNISFFALGNTTQNSSTVLNANAVSFNGLGAVTVGYSNGSIQVSVPVQSAQTQSNIAGIYDGANSISTGTIRFSNLNGISFGINGQTLTGSHNGITSQTAQTIGLYALGNTTQNSSTTLDARTLSFNGLGAATVGYSNGSIQVSVPTQSVQTQNMVSVQGSTGNISFSNLNGISFGFNNSTITASHNGITSQSNQNISLFALGNTTQNSSTVLNANAVSFNGIGAATVGYSNGSIQVSVPTQTVQTQSNIAGLYDGVNSISTGTVRFTNANGVSWSINGQTISASVSTQPTLSFWEPEAAAGMQGNSVGNATLSFVRLNVPNNINATQMALLQHFSNSTGNVSGATITYYAAIYTMGGSTANMISSNSQSLSFNLNSTTNASSVYGGQSGTRYRTVGLGGTWNITPGDYLFAIGMRISTQATSLSVSHWCRPAVSINAIPGGGNFSQFFMHGVYSASTSGIPANVQLSEINATGSAAQRVPYFVLAGTF